jgi:hypothetical protein
VSWTALPSGEAITLAPGYIYAASASVKSSHTTQDIRNLAASHGLTVLDLTDPAAISGQTPDSGYRFVAITVAATQSGTLPWGVPWYVPGDSSTILQAWVEPSQSAPAGEPPVPAAPSASPWPWIVAATLVGGLGYALWKRHKA